MIGSTLSKKFRKCLLQMARSLKSVSLVKLIPVPLVFHFLWIREEWWSLTICSSSSQSWLPSLECKGCPLGLSLGMMSIKTLIRKGLLDKTINTLNNNLWLRNNKTKRELKYLSGALKGSSISTARPRLLGYAIRINDYLIYNINI